jgi:hypothetical protein
MSVVFDGNQDRLQLAATPGTIPTLTTIIAWIKPAAFSTRDTIFCFYNSSPDDYHGPYGFTGGVLRFRSPWSSSNGVWSTPAASLVASAWQAIAVTYDAGNVANTPAMYKKPEGGAFSTLSVSVTQAPTGTFDTPANGSWIGGVITSYPFNGRIAYVRVFNSILTPTQIEAEMDNAAAQLSALYDLPLIANTNDSSGNGHNGTLLGDAALDGDNPTLASMLSPHFLQLIPDCLMDDIRQKGTTSQSLEVFFRDSTTGLGKTGLLYNSAGMAISYYRRGAAAAASITLATLANLNSSWSSGGFKEIGGGWYRLDVPDAAIATGVPAVRLYGSATGAIMDPVTMLLTDYDPALSGPTPADVVAAMDASSTKLSGISGTTLATSGKVDTLLEADVAYKKNIAVPGFLFPMRLNSGAPGTGLTVSGAISQNGGSFVPLANPISEVGSGWYKVDVTQTEMNADEIAFTFNATAAVQRDIKIRTQS